MAVTRDLATLLIVKASPYLLVGRDLGDTGRWIWQLDEVDLLPADCDERVLFTSSKPVITTSSFWHGLLRPSLERLGTALFLSRYGCAATAPADIHHDFDRAVRWSS